MQETLTIRRLIAIMAVDVAGYSRMMASDETGTLAALKQHRANVFDRPSPLIVAGWSN